jgi:hypothetical protein
VIVKKIPNPKKSVTKSVRITGLGNYIAEPQRENGTEKCIHSEAHNFLTTDYQAQLSEMIALASETRSKDPVDHWVLSWHEDEHPTIEQAREAVNIFIRQCGLVGHQYVWGYHQDTDNKHVHIQVNRVHPDTLKVVKINKGFDKEAGQQAGASIEHAQGWKPEKGARYEIVNGKPILRADQDKRKQLEPTSAARAMEQQTGTKSAQRIGIEDATPAIQQARNWRELHDNLAAAGMRYERKGSGAVIYVGNVAVKASDVSRAASLSALQKRLGAYQPAQEINRNEYNHHRVIDRNQATQQNLATLGKEPGHHLQNLSERGLATLSEGGKAKRASVLSLDAQPDRQRDLRLRRDTGRGTDRERAGNNHGNSTNTGRAKRELRSFDGSSRAGQTGERSRLHVRPLREGQQGWEEYQTIKAELKAKKEGATTNLQASQQAQRDALFEEQKAERSELFTRSWRGQGTLRNAMLSIIAARHAAEKLELQERQKAEREAMREQYRPLPQYKDWKERPQIVSHTDQIEVKPVAQPQLAVLLRSLRQSPDLSGYFTYRFGSVALFRDEGKTIAVLDQSSQSIAAALAVAQTKYGRVLTLTGSYDFQVRAVRAAVEHGLSVKFKDAALDALRERLQAEKYQAERQAAREAQVVKEAAATKEKEAQAERTTVAERESERAQPTTNQPAPQEPQPVPVQQPKEESLPTVEVDAPAFACAEWLTQQPKELSEPRKSGDGELEFVVAYLADSVVLDHGRTVALYPRPGFELRTGDRVVIHKDGSLSLAPDRFEQEKDKGPKGKGEQGR